MANTPMSRYQRDLQKPEFEQDAAQLKAVEFLQSLYESLVEADSNPVQQGMLQRLGWGKKEAIEPIKGLYFWGGVGRGKTYLVDMFYETLPFDRKLRMHFHRFMRRVHKERKLLRDQQDPLQIIGKQLAEEARILCFDEFVVNDIADAVILARLMKVLFENGVSFVATSNVEPINLYLNGLQRDLFLPAIDLIYKHTDVVNIDSGIDYRLRFLDKAETYFSPLQESAEKGMAYNFENLAPDVGLHAGTIEIEGRELAFIRRADGVVWFDFMELCDGPRSQNDYIELARCFQTILVSNVPIMDKLKDDQARRFINLIDVLYDHNVNLIVSAAAPAHELYTGKRVSFEFQRTISRLQEMQSHEYLAMSHTT